MKESDIQRCILDGLAAKHIFAFRLNTAAMKVGDRFFRAHSLGKGAADILAFPRSLLVIAGSARFRWLEGAPAVWWLEVKAPHGSVSLEQMSFGNRVEAEGHQYSIVRCWADVELQLKAWQL